MKIVNQALLKVAEEVARRFGYIEVEHYTQNLMKSDFWGTSFYATKQYVESEYKEIPTFEVVKYILPVFEDEKDENKSRPRIELRVRFRNPRIGIYFPEGGYVGLEYSPEGEFKEAQIFDERGYDYLPVIKEKVAHWINKLKS
jgi:hypothetical protein